MAKTDLTAQRLRELVTYNPETGIFDSLNLRRCGRKSASGLLGWSDGPYWRLCLDGRRQWAHRLAFLYMTGELPHYDVDHIDGNGANNRWSNLRDVPTYVNVQNIKQVSANKAGFTGVESTASGTFQARISTRGFRLNLGTFPTKEEARDAYATAKRKIHEGCTF